MGKRGIRKRGFHSKHIPVLSLKTHQVASLVSSLSPPAGVLAHLRSMKEKAFAGSFIIGTGKGANWLLIH